MNVTGTAPGGIPRELMCHSNRFQLQFSTSVELISQYRYRIGPLSINLERISLPMVFRGLQLQLSVVAFEYFNFRYSYSFLARSHAGPVVETPKLLASSPIVEVEKHV